MQQNYFVPSLISSDRLLQRYVLKGGDLLELIIFTAPLRLFLSETSISFLQVHESAEYNDCQLNLVPPSTILLWHQQIPPPTAFAPPVQMSTQ